MQYILLQTKNCIFNNTNCQKWFANFHVTIFEKFVANS